MGSSRLGQWGKGSSSGCGNRKMKRAAAAAIRDRTPGRPKAISFALHCQDTKPDFPRKAFNRKEQREGQRRASVLLDSGKAGFVQKVLDPRMSGGHGGNGGRWRSLSKCLPGQLLQQKVPRRGVGFLQQALSQRSKDGLERPAIPKTSIRSVARARSRLQLLQRCNRWEYGHSDKKVIRQPSHCNSRQDGD